MTVNTRPTRPISAFHKRLSGLRGAVAGGAAPPGIHEWTPDRDVWELYHLDQDWSQAHDLAVKMPEKLAR